MAPRSTTQSAGDDDDHHDTHSPLPGTTAAKTKKLQEKMTKAPKSKPAAATPPPTRKRKAGLLPPPEEYAAMVEAEAEAAKNKGRKKVLTTKQKILAAEKAAKAKARAKPILMKKKREDSKPKPSKAKSTIPGMMSQLDGHRSSATRYTVKEEVRKDSVLFRRTKRSEKYLRDQSDQKDGLLKFITDSCKLPYAKPKPGTGLMDLPREVRDMIWKLAVVETEHFIWPDTPTGGEQPDLAKVSRQIRCEVLPIFYGENVFAIELSDPVKQTKSPGLGNPVDLLAVKKWAEALGEKNKLGLIRKWAFDWDDCVTSNSKDDKSFTVFLELRQTKKKGGEFWAGEIAIHHGAQCILHSQPCRLKPTPQWLDLAVYKVLDVPGHPVIDPEKVLGLAREVIQKRIELAESRCGPEPVVPSIEKKVTSASLQD